MKTIALALAATAGGSLLAADQDFKNTSLPLREVILYSSGVGYFERAGEVSDRARIELRFRTEDINDLLKSMVVQDLGGGTVGAITYDSRDPISKTLQSFAIDLTANPSMRELLNQMRGEPVDVLWPNATTGTIIGVETREVEIGKEAKRNEDFVNVLGLAGLQSIPLSQVQQIKFKNEKIQRELTEALAVLARGHDTEKKTVALTFDGQGNRTVNVAYIAEAPVWKTSYRLVLDDKEGFLQGWAIVENTGDDDWDNVQLSLVSGRPISFKMDLYQPLYAPRPVVQPELYLSLRPQVYQEGELALGALADKPAELKEERGFAKSLARRDRMESLRGNALSAAAPASAPALAFFGADAGIGGGGGISVPSAAQGGVTGELFQYALKMPVSIQRQKSAMLPIVTEKMEGRKLSIYNQNVQAKHPLNGFRLKNTSDLHLMQGPITVFDGGSYAGDARIEDLAPGQDRLISYAVDLKTEVEPQSKSEPETLVSVRIRHGVFYSTKKLVEEKTYLVRNKDRKSKTVLVEHPVRADWTLEAPAKPSEKARDVYRFESEVEAGKSASVVVRESHLLREEAGVITLPWDTYGFYLNSGKVSPRVKDALRKVMEHREALQQFAADRKLREDRINEIGQEQTRIRENMARLSQNSELYQRYVKKFDEQETEFERLRAEAAKIKQQEADRQRQLNDFLSSLDLE